MKNTLYIVLLFITAQASAQLITFPQYRKGIETQFGVFVDPLGAPSNGGAGRQKGVMFTALMNGGYIEISASNFSQLQNGYSDLVVSGGVNFHVLGYDKIRYFAGLRLSPFVFRDARYELAGFVLGVDCLVTNPNRDVRLYIGGMIYVDHCEDLEDGKGYRNSSYYKGGILFKSSTVRENGAIRLSVRF